MSSVSRNPFTVSPQKRALIEAKLREEGVIAGSRDAIVPRAHGGPAPLSFAQQRLWFFDQFEPGSSLYNLLSPILFEGDLDASALEGAFNGLIERHEVLRTSFDFRDGQPVQVVAPVQRLTMSTVDLTGLAEQEQQRKMESLAREEAGRPFDLKRGPLLRTTLLRLADRKYVLLFAVHHIVCDAWSTALMIHELGHLYASIRSGRPASLPELRIQYADFAAWQRQWLQGAVLERQLEYWKAKLGDSLPVLELPADRPRPAIRTFNGSSVSFVVPPAVSQSLKALVQSERATLFMTLLAAFKVLLSRYTGLDDITVGTPIANRQRHEVEHLIGFFTNTLAIRTDLSGNPRFRDLLKAVRENLLDAYGHQDLPFEYLVEQLHPERTLSHSPLVQVMFVLRNAHDPELKFPGVTATPLKSDFATAKFDLSVYLDDTGDGIEGEIEYNTDLFATARIERMCGQFQTLLTAIARNPSELLSDLQLLTDAEREQLLVEWNRTQVPYPRACAHELFEQQAERSPNSTALLLEAAQLTYAELNSRANKIAHRLQRLGARPGTVVAILMERSPEMIAAVLGILKAGAACLPLNPSYPAQRLAFMLQDSGAAAVLSQGPLASSLPQTAARTVCVDAEWESIERESGGNLPSQAGPEAGCYIIYTSGSTGTPKGVVMPHRALVNLVEWHRAAGSSSGCVLQFASLTFDVSFQEMFSTFALGGTLVLLPEPARVDMRALGSFIAENKIERFHLPVVVLQKLAEEFCENPQPLSSLRELMVGGEQLQITRPITRLFEQLSGCMLYNHYGPSETHVVTSYLLPQSPANWPSLPPLGRQIANVRAYVLDSHLQPVPVGITGVLYLGGECLAHGYLNRPALTAERFIPDPFSRVPGARIYKTGDLVRYAGSGDIEFVGRNDFQVKIRGMRIELPEVELALAQHPAVREAVVTVHQDGPASGKRLAGYVVPQPDATITPKELREFLRERLPEHMVPFHFTILAAFPLTSSGKINRLALPSPEKSIEAAEGYVEPKTAVEKALAAIFGDVLDAQAVGLSDNFFDLGGHSLMATQIASRIREAFRIELPVRAIFEEPTVGGLSRLILLEENDRRRIERTAELLVEFSSGPASERNGLPGTNEQILNIDVNSNGLPGANPEKIHTAVPVASKVLRTAPVSFAQQRLWFLHQYDPQSTLYNLPAALRLKGQVHITALEKSLNEIVRRHESLRTTFDISGEKPIQIIHEPSSWRLQLTDLQNLADVERQQLQNQLIADEADRPFDLAKGPLLRTHLLCISPIDHIFLVTMHHIVSDGWSIQVFIREFAALYDANCRNESFSLPELPIQYADFASWQREWLQGAVLSEQLGYWKEQLANAPQLLELPADRPRPVYKTFHGAAVLFDVPQSLAGEVVQLGRLEGTTLFMTLLAAFYVLLYRYTGQEDLLVGTPIAGRNRRDVEGLIGFFINTLVMRARLSGQMSFRQLLQHVREICLQAYTHQDVPFEKLVEELHPERNLSHSPLFQTVFHLQNVLNEELHLAGVAVSTVETDIKKAKFDLSLAISETSNGLKGILNYNTDLFDAGTIRRMATHFQKLLESAVRNPGEQIACMPILAAAEEKQLLVTWNDFKRDYGRERLVHEVLQDQARRRPDAVAVRFEHKTLTYAELNRRANQLAHHLRKLGVGSEDMVGICVERSLEMMVGLFGILKSGAAYLPLDPAYPKGRLAFMLDDAGVKVLVTQQALAQNFPERGEQRIYLDAQAGSLGEENQEDPESFVRPENLAYVIYTSGSTGKPKGIMIEHRNLANYIGWANELMFHDALETVPAVQALTFDGSLKQIFAPLLRGLEVWVLSQTEVTDPVSLIHALSVHRDIRFSAVPSLWKAILDALESGQAALAPGVITHAFIGGEELPKSLADRSFALLPDLLLWNFYGPSEITATATAAFLRPGEQISLGKPIAGKKVHILDAQLQPVPVGVAGEIYIGREGLARGYIQRPDLTAASFIPDPFSDEPGARLYRTRDRAQYLPDGRIEFLGRFDDQVKLRGFRIELGEIEASLREHSAVEEAVAAIRTSAEGEQQLVAYVVPAWEPAPAAAELRAFLKDRLPEYMLPSAWVTLDRLPLTANGKLNRAALPEPERGKRDVESPFVSPRTALEETIAEMFAELLGVPQVGVHDNFFQLGGHSLLATRVVARIRKMLKAELTLRRFFEGPTVAEVAQALAAHELTPGQLDERAALLRNIEHLSADDLEELLRQKRAKEAG